MHTMTQSEPNWEWYRTFLTVLETGSLSAAARAMGLTQPTVGRHIDNLESALALKLFTRSFDGFAPTDAALEAWLRASVLPILDGYLSAVPARAASISAAVLRHLSF